MPGPKRAADTDIVFMSSGMQGGLYSSRRDVRDRFMNKRNKHIEIWIGRKLQKREGDMRIQIQLGGSNFHTDVKTERRHNLEMQLP